MPSFDLIDDPVFPLSIEGRSSQYTSDNVAYDYAINGLPFKSFASNDIPLERALAPIRKQQVDQSDNPGEQSLDSWWLRSQTDWSGGAGLDFMEPASDGRVQRSYHSSAGVNVWNVGEVSLLRSTSSVRAIAGAEPRVARYNSGSGLYYGAGSTIDQYNGSSWASTTGFSGTLDQLVPAGSKILAVNTSGTIFSASSGGTTFTSLWTTASGATRSWWVKQRLITAQGADLFELGLGGGDLDLQTPYYTHPDSTWVWSAAFEAPGAILVAGYGSAGSAIYKFVLDADGTLPTISGAITTAEFPIGEYITDGFTYLGSLIAIATNLGIRVGNVAANGDVTYGPFTYEGTVLGKFRPWSRFLYTAVANAGDGRPGLLRIDLSDIGDDGRAPYALDIRVPSGTSAEVKSFAVVNEDEVYLACSGNLFGCTAASNLESSGWLRTGFVRYGTIEKKNFDTVSVEMAQPLAGQLTVYSVTKDGNTVSIGSYGGNASTEESLRIGIPTTPQKHLGLKFQLDRDSTTPTTGPVLENWQMRAVPSPTRAELMQIPLMCFDFEEDEYGQMYGFEGAALARWVELRDEVRDSRTIRIQNFNTNESYICVVEELSFKQTASPTKSSSFGGVILCTVRTL